MPNTYTDVAHSLSGSWFDNLSFKGKMLLPIILVVLTMVLVLAVGTIRQQSANNTIARFGEVHLPTIDHILQADRDLYQSFVAERSYLMSEPSSDAAKGMLKDHKSNIGQVRDRLGKYANIMDNNDSRMAVDQALAQLNTWERTSTRVIELRNVSTYAAPTAAITLSFNDSEAQFQSVRDLLDTLGEAQIKLSAQEIESEHSATQKGITSMLVIGITGIGACIIILFIVMSIVSGRLVKIVQRMNSIADGEGDLTSRIEDISKDEVGQIGKAFNQFIHKIHEIVGSARSVSQSVTLATADITDLSQRTEQHVDGLQTTMTSLDQLTQTIEQTSQHAKLASESAKDAKQVAEQGGTHISEVIAAMKDIADSSNKISKIINIVDEISFQTNLLALNAAVEAARAGEQGLGFAVVANEVRNLAQRSSEAAAEIKSHIEDSSKKISRGADLVDRSGESLVDIVSSAEKVSQLITDISVANLQQSSGIHSVNQSIVASEKVNQHNAKMVRDATAASAELNHQASHLSHILSQFKLGRKAA